MQLGASWPSSADAAASAPPVPPPQCYVGAAMLGIGYIAARILMPDGKQEGIE